MSRWTICLIFSLAFVGCSSDAEQSQESCERIRVDGTPYCTYEQPITETGYDCPSDLPNAIEFEGHTVCSADEQLPAEHEAPIREHFESSGGERDAGRDLDGSEALLAAVCENPTSYDGRTITVPGDSLQLDTVWHVHCNGTGGSDGGDASDLCCGASSSIFTHFCKSSPTSNPTRIVFNPGQGLSASFDCNGDNCGPNCDPAAPYLIQSVTGVVHSNSAPYISDYESSPPSRYGEFAVEVEVSEFQLNQ